MIEYAVRKVNLYIQTGNNRYVNNTVIYNDHWLYTEYGVVYLT